MRVGFAKPGTALVGSLAVFGAASWAQTDTRDAMFRGLGDLPGGKNHSNATAISGDGAVVVGYSETNVGLMAVRWTAEGIAPLGELPGGRFRSDALGVSDDGGVIVGSSHGPDGSVAVIFHHDGPTSIGGWTDDTRALRAFGVSGDGRVIVGERRRARSSLGWRWQEGALSDLPAFADGSQPSAVRAVSADGTTLAGNIMSPAGLHAFRSDAFGRERLADLPGGATFSDANAVTADGRIVAGFSSSVFGMEAARWADGVVLALGALTADRILQSEATAVSADGRIIVGSALNLDESMEAFVWDAVNGMRALREVLVDDGGLDLFGWRLHRANGVSSDGRTIVGSGTNPEGRSEAWIARLPRPRMDGVALDPADRDHRAFLVPTATIGGLVEPRGVCFDDAGTLLVADAGAACIRRFDRAGTSRTTWGPRLDASTRLLRPVAVAQRDDGLFVVVDAGAHCLFVIDDGGRLRDTVSGPGRRPGRLDNPGDLAVHDGLVFVADTGNARVQVFDAEGMFTGVLELPGVTPAAVTVDGDGNVVVLDADRAGIFRVSADGKPHALAGSPGDLPGLFRGPTDVAWIDGAFWVVDQGSNRVQVVARDGKTLAIWGGLVVRPRAAGGRLRSPGHLTADAANTIVVVSEPLEGRCQVFERRLRDASIPPVLRKRETGARWHGRDLDVDGELVAVTRPNHDVVELIAASDRTLPILALGHTHVPLSTLVGSSGRRPGAFRRPEHVAIDAASGRLYVSDAGNKRVQVLLIEGADPRDIGSGFRPSVKFIRARTLAAPDDDDRRPGTPGAIDVGPDGTVYVIDRHRRRVVGLNPDLQTRTWFPAARTTPVQDDPIDLAVDPRNGRVLVLDGLDSRIDVFDPDGQRLGRWRVPTDGTAGLCGVTVDADGFVYVTDRLRDRIIKLDAAGEHIADLGRSGLAAGAMHRPRGIGVDGRGRLFVSDWGNDRIQVLSSSGDSIVTFGAALYAQAARE